MLIKTPLLHQSLGPRVFLSFFLFLHSVSLSLSLSISGSFLGAQGPAELTFLPGLLAHCYFTHSRGHPVPTCIRESPENRALLAFRVNQGTSASFSLLLSGPPGSSPLKDQHRSSKCSLHKGERTRS